jgi:hypothetical protein
VLAADVDADPAAGLTQDVIRDLVRERLAGYKVPRVVVFDDALPRVVVFDDALPRVVVFDDALPREDSGKTSGGASATATGRRRGAASRRSTQSAISRRGPGFRWPVSPNCSFEPICL